MSNYLAVAQATEALRRSLARSLQADVPYAVKVTARKPLTEPPADPTVTIFLYQVTPNAALRNRDAPTRDQDGTLLTKPQIAVDLHYVISFYGDEAQLQPQQLLGSVVRSLHEEPMLLAADINDAAAQPFLSGADLAASPQRVRFTPTKQDVEELSKLWSTMFQIPYALSVTYQATAVLLDGKGTPAAGKPVLRHTVRAVSGGRPIIDRVLSRPAGSSARLEEGPVPRGHEVWLAGQALRGNGVVVRVGSVDITPTRVGEDVVVFSFPEDSLQALTAGTYPVRVLHAIDTSDSAVTDGSAERTPPHVVESNTTVVTRQPHILGTQAGGVNPITLTLRLDIPVGDHQRVQLLLDELDPPTNRPAASYEVTAPYPLASRPGRDTVQVPVHNVRPAVYLVRVQVDGVPSRTADDLRTPTVDLRG